MAYLKSHMIHVNQNEKNMIHVLFIKNVNPNETNIKKNFLFFLFFYFFHKYKQRDPIRGGTYSASESASASASESASTSASESESLSVYESHFLQ